MIACEMFIYIRFSFITKKNKTLKKKERDSEEGKDSALAPSMSEAERREVST